MAEEKTNGGNDNRRRLRESVRERIRSRGSVDGNGGNAIGDGGRVGGNGGRVGGNADGTTASGATERVDTGAVVGSEGGNSLAENHLRIIGQSSDGRTPRIRDTAGSDSDRSAASGNDTGENGQPFATTSSVINLAEIEAAVPPKRKVGRPPKQDGKKPKPTGAPDYSDIVFPLSIALDFVFHIPAALGGKQFSFWELSDDDKTDLVDDFKTLLEAFPSETTEQFIKALEKWIPLLTLGINLYSIMKPRLVLTQQVIAENKRKAIADAKDKQTEKAGTPVRIDNYREQAIG